MAQTDARERLRQLRADLAARDRANIASGDAARARRLIAGLLLKHRPDDPLGRKMAACRDRNQANDSRVHCGSAACPACMQRHGRSLVRRELWPSLAHVPSHQLRWVTVLMFSDPDLDSGATEMKRQHRKLAHVFKKFAADTGKAVRAWGAREVELHNAWLFHVHMLVDLAGADADALASRLRDVFGYGDRQVRVDLLDRKKSQEENINRIGQYMTKVRYSSKIGGRNVWFRDDEIVELAMWRAYRVSLQWHRFTLNVRNFR